MTAKARGGEPLGLDDTDLQILQVVRGNGRISIRELADKTGLPETTARDRLHALERTGAITGYRPVLNTAAVGFDIQAWVFVDASDAPSAADTLLGDPVVLSVYPLTEKPGQYALRVATRNSQALSRALERWRREWGIEVQDLMLLDDLDMERQSLEAVEWERNVQRTLKATY